MTIFFTSDTHYGHKNIIGYSGRPYDSLEEMRDDLIVRWNSVVKPGDQVYHLGDFSFYDEEETIKILKRLNGQKFLLWGNHDKRFRKSKAFMSQWQWCKDLAEIYCGETKVVLCHFALLVWNKSHHGSYHLHGHSHGTLRDDPHARRLDVGVDVKAWNFYPVSFEEIDAVMKKKGFVPVDQHGSRGNGQ